MSRPRVRHHAEYFAFRTVVALVECCSPRLAARFAQGFAWFLCHFMPSKLTRHKVARENLSKAFGDEYSQAEQDRIIEQMWAHLFRMVTEIIHLRRKLHLRTYRDAIEFRNIEQSLEALHSGRPVILLSGHFGNWEMAVAIFGLFGFPMGVVARELDNPFLQKWFQEFRESTGHRLMLKKGGFDDMLAMINRGGNLALLGDQDAGPRGQFVEFFGHPASTFKSIALLAMEYDAIICVGYARRLPDDWYDQHWVRYELGCAGVIDPRECTTEHEVREITEKYTAALEAVVRTAPEQYFWIHRRWKSEPRRRSHRQRQSAAA